jgi:cobalt-zinc-cadmium efflux system membrane fusion protein
MNRLSPLVFAFLLGCFSAPDAVHDDHAPPKNDVVELTPEAIAAARIEVRPVEESVLSDGLTLPGRVVLDPRKDAIVSTWIAGQVDAIAVRPGETVTRGQQLAQVQSPELGEAVGTFRTANARDEAADARLERLKRLEADGVSSRAQILEAEADHAEAEGDLEAAEERLKVLGVSLDVGNPHDGHHFPSRVPVRSPIAGKVLTANASVGERVDPGQTLFHVGNLDEVWLLLDVYERDLARVRKGQAVRFSVEAWPEETFEGEVAQVGDWIEPDARTIEVRVVVANPDHKLKPNMFANAELTTNREVPERGIILPLGAVVKLKGVDVVFVEETTGHFVARPVVVGKHTATQVLLASGLALGESVVIEGAFVLKSELEKGELGDGHAH